jgi:hypothetical protein
MNERANTAIPEVNQLGPDYERNNPMMNARRYILFELERTEMRRRSLQNMLEAIGKWIDEEQSSRARRGGGEKE